ncbi:hypothetical protein HYDPIDRAFT_114697 [Hydnomerulius pinastri MD-312]|uniref:Uncharacterized protein n=1 Tax=Hydnomerulius pinastri MD-312 TaxID=994086 RepID=A0A0C9WCK3_9AGAM|nr:hypothetical protein HYDPIDRAFT_114697 [Hydnomerulius pinastri MD-312]
MATSIEEWIKSSSDANSVDQERDTVQARSSEQSICNSNRRLAGSQVYAHSQYQDSVSAPSENVSQILAPEEPRVERSQHADMIDMLDFDSLSFHRDGPYAAAAPSRNRDRNQAPMFAWSSPSPEDCNQEPLRGSRKKGVDVIAEAWGIHEPEPYEEFSAGEGDYKDHQDGFDDNDTGESPDRPTTMTSPLRGVHTLLHRLTASHDKGRGTEVSASDGDGDTKKDTTCSQKPTIKGFQRLRKAFVQRRKNGKNDEPNSSSNESGSSQANTPSSSRPSIGEVAAGQYKNPVVISGGGREKERLQQEAGPASAGPGPRTGLIVSSSSSSSSDSWESYHTGSARFWNWLCFKCTCFCC